MTSIYGPYDSYSLLFLFFYNSLIFAKVLLYQRFYEIRKLLQYNNLQGR